jgi:NAD+ synthase
MNSLTIDPEQSTQQLETFILETVQDAGFTQVVLGISGGIDSALSCYLAARALGPENVLTLKMPYQTSSPESLAHAEQVVEATGVKTRTFPITKPVNAILAHFPDADRVRQGNVMARVRMIHIYDQAAARSGLVIGTGNKTEALLGYTTLHGDSACDFNPLGDLYKTQVRQLAAYLEIPEVILKKAPSADLWVDQTDEEELGFTYEKVDRLLFELVEKGVTGKECLDAGFEEGFVREVIARVKQYRYKSTLPPIGSIGQQPLGDLEQLPAFSG